MVLALAVAIGVVRWWPVPVNQPSDRTFYQVAERETIDLEEIQPTRQRAAAPAPPAPPLPIVVPDDEVLEDDVIDFSNGLLELDVPGDELIGQQGDADATAPVSGVTVGPKTVRFVEPEYTREARRRRVRAELVVRVFVDESGRVEEATILERFLLNEDGSARQPVNELGYGLEEAALSAADRWMFRPARKDGKPVASQTTLTFTFGVDT